MSTNKMKKQLVGWFFCVLLSSSIAQDLLQKQASLQDAQSQGQVGGTQPTTGGNWIKYVCHRDNKYVIAICNNEENMCIIIDCINKMFMICEGNGTGFICDTKTNTCKTITTGCWNASSTSLQEYCRTCDMKALFTLTTNISISITSPPLAVLLQVQKCLVILGAGSSLSIQAQVNLNACLSLCISVCTEIIDILGVKLFGLIKLDTTDFVIISAGGLLEFLEILRGVVDLLVTANLLLKVLVDVGVILDIQRILAALDGVQCFTYVATQIGAKLDIVVHLNVVITNITILLRICVRLGGNVFTGVTGVFRVMAEVLAVISGTLTIDLLLLTIINVCVKVNGQLTITACVNALQTLVDAQIALWNNGSGLVNIINLITNLKAQTWTVAKINLSAIITLLITGVVTTYLDLFVRIVGYLKVYTTATITVDVWIMTCLKVIFFLLNTIQGRIVINLLIPGLKIPVILSNVCLNLLDGLLVTIIQIVALITQSLVLAIKAVTSLSIVFNELSKSCSSILGLNLTIIINANKGSAIYNEIANWMKNIDHCGC